MRHGKQKGKLSRDSAHRKSLMMNLSREVIDHERIQTTEAKAKAVKPELERLITLAKRGDHHSRRQAMSRLGQDKFIVYKLFEEIAPRYAERPGGYTGSSSSVRASRTRPRWSFSSWSSAARSSGLGRRRKHPSVPSAGPTIVASQAPTRLRVGELGQPGPPRGGQLAGR